MLKGNACHYKACYAPSTYHNYNTRNQKSQPYNTWPHVHLMSIRVPEVWLQWEEWRQQREWWICWSIMGGTGHMNQKALVLMTTSYIVIQRSPSLRRKEQQVKEAWMMTRIPYCQLPLPHAVQVLGLMKSRSMSLTMSLKRVSNLIQFDVMLKCFRQCWNTNQQAR